jgi:hypothetical protein
MLLFQTSPRSRKTNSTLFWSRPETTGAVLCNCHRVKGGNKGLAAISTQSDRTRSSEPITTTAIYRIAFVWPSQSTPSVNGLDRTMRPMRPCYPTWCMYETNSMELGSFLRFCSRSVASVFPKILCNLRVRCHVPKNLLLVSILSRMKPVYTTPSILLLSSHLHVVLHTNLFTFGLPTTIHSSSPHAWCMFFP